MKESSWLRFFLLLLLLLPSANEINRGCSLLLLLLLPGLSSIGASGPHASNKPMHSAGTYVLRILRAIGLRGPFNSWRDALL
jgi:hypothetical protein